MKLRALLGSSLLLLAFSAQAMGPEDGGTFIALDQDGQPAQKIFRASQRDGKWTFEDRQPDGTWLDVSCHGGCEHRASSAKDMMDFFGGPPPPSIKPECVHNAQYAFCHFVPASDDVELDGYVLVVKVKQGWHPITLVRVPDPSRDAPKRPAPLEAALLSGWRQ